MKIYMCDVNFGECILYADRRCLMVVDCGAKFGQDEHRADWAAREAYRRGVQALQPRNGFKEKVLVITHMDGVHYNALPGLPPEEKFRSIYLPGYYYQKTRKGYEVGGLFYRMAWARAFFYLTGHPTKLTLLHQLLCQLPERLEEGGEICCVTQEDEIRGAGRRFRVLWPHRQSELHRTEALTDRLRELLFEVLQRRGGGQEEQDHYLAVLEEVALSLLDLYDFYAAAPRRKGRPNVVREEQRRADRAARTARLEAALAELKALPKLELTRSEAGRSGYVTRELLEELNACSLVFEQSRELLACGDATPEVLKYLRAMGQLGRRYRVVKLPCHGVEGYCSPDLPEAELGLISNNGAHRWDWSISERWRTQPVERLCCTNNIAKRCELYNNGMPARCEHCQIWNGGRDRLLELRDGKPIKIRK